MRESIMSDQHSNVTETKAPVTEAANTDPSTNQQATPANPAPEAAPANPAQKVDYVKHITETVKKNGPPAIKYSLAVMAKVAGYAAKSLESLSNKIKTDDTQAPEEPSKDFTKSN